MLNTTAFLVLWVGICCLCKSHKTKRRASDKGVEVRVGVYTLWTLLCRLGDFSGRVCDMCSSLIMRENGVFRVCVVGADQDASR